MARLMYESATIWLQTEHAFHLGIVEFYLLYIIVLSALLMTLQFVAKVNFLPSNQKVVECQMSNPSAATGNPETVKATVVVGTSTDKVVKCDAFSRHQVIPDKIGEHHYFLHFYDLCANIHRH